MTTSLIIGYISSSLIYPYLSQGPIFFSVFFCVIQLVIIITLNDYKVIKKINFRNIINDSFEGFKPVFKGLINARWGLVLMTLIILPSIIDVGPSNQWQAVFFDENFQSLTSYVWVVITISGMIGSIVSNKLFKNLSTSKAFLLLVYFSILLVIVMSLNIPMIIRVIIFSLYIIINTSCGIKGSTRNN